LRQLSKRALHREGRAEHNRQSKKSSSSQETGHGFIPGWRGQTNAALTK
jgi:hypothetical protein